MIMFSGLAFAWTLAGKWPLRPYSWFWLTMAGLSALQVPLIASVGSMTERYTGPSIAVALFCGIDYLAMLIVLNFIAQCANKPALKRDHGA